MKKTIFAVIVLIFSAGIVCADEKTWNELIGDIQLRMMIGACYTDFPVMAMKGMKTYRILDNQNRVNAKQRQAFLSDLVAMQNRLENIVPTTAYGYYTRGNRYYADKDYDRAFAHMNKGNFPQARADVNRALEINSNYQDAKTLSEELRQKGY